VYGKKNCNIIKPVTMRKTIFACMAFLASTMLHAQANTAFNFTFNHQAISVKDVQASVDFYSKVFQLKEITNRSGIEGIRWISLGEGKELHVISTLKEPIVLNKAIHLAMATTNYDAFLKHLDALGITYYDWPGKEHTVNVRADGVKQIYFKDPDGYWIEINNGYAAVPSAEQIKNEVWQLEEKYWQYVKANDTKSYFTLWDDNFIGYPGNNKIAGKDHITDWIVDLHKNKTGAFDYTLTRKVENVFTDIVIVLYDVAHNSMKAGVKKTTYKITHTWKKTDKGWVIIGGMGANK
jgi:lactoylglutathione lyase